MFNYITCRIRSGTESIARLYLTLPTNSTYLYSHLTFSLCQNDEEGLDGLPLHFSKHTTGASLRASIDKGHISNLDLYYVICSCEFQLYDLLLYLIIAL